MASGQFFNGNFTRRPGVRARIDDFGLAAFTIGSSRIVAVIGKAEGGVPGTPKLFSSPNEASALLRKGELLDAVKLAFDPSAENPGATLVYGVRVNPATQATLSILKGTTAVINITSVNYGLQDNQIKVKVETGSVQGKKLSLGKGTDLYVKDNLFREAFTLQYVGTGTAATVTINGTTLTTAITGGPGGESLNVDFTVYNTVQKLVDFIAARAGYTAVVKTTNPDEPTLNGLDFVTAGDIKLAVRSVTSTLQAIIDWINSGQQPLVTAVRPALADGAPDNLAVFTYLAGGSEGATLQSHWQAALDALQSKGVALIVPVTSDAAVHAIAVTHSAAMSQDGRRPRKAILGAALGEYSATLSNYTSRATSLNSDRAVLVAQGVKGFDAAGQVVTFPPYVVAAQIAGLQAGVGEIGDAVTYKSITATGLEWTPTSAELEIMIDGGVLPIELVENRGFFRVTRGITTWRKNDDFHRVEISTGIALDEVIRSVITGLEVFVGQKASPIMIHRVASRSETLLALLQQQGVIVGDDASPAFRNIQVSLSGDVVSVAFEVSPVVPVNFISVSVHASTFEGTFKVAVR